MPRNLNKAKSISVKVSEQEFEMLQKGAESTGLPVSQFILYSCSMFHSLASVLTDIDHNLAEINEKLDKK